MNKAALHEDRGWKAVKKRDLDKAERHFRGALAVSVERPSAIHGVGLVALQRGEVHQGVKLLARALEMQPDDIHIARHYAAGLLKAHRPDEALDLLQSLSERVPKRADIWVNLAAAYLEVEPARPEAAEDAAKRAIALQGMTSRAALNLGNAMRQQQRHKEAAVAYDDAERLGIDRFNLQLNRGLLARDQGDMDGAADWFQSALETNPISVDAVVALAHVSRFEADDQRLAYFTRAVKGAGQWTRRQRISFFFSWAKALDSAGRHADAFQCMEEGNRQRREEYTDDSVTLSIASLQQIASVVDDQWMASRAEAGIDDSTPIFILGMPRSGTTLVEQILAAHPDVHAAGELPKLGQLLQPIPERLDGLSVAEARQVARDYLAYLTELAPDAPRVTDKMPHNFRFVGVIAALFPRASIIHCRRDPMDVCLSNFQQNFSAPHPYTHQLDELGAYYGAYYRLMEHWRAMLGDRLIEVDHADLAGRPEEEIPQLLDLLGLPFDSACLRPHEHRRSVRTASAYQVTQPISTATVARWRAYEEQLAPLRERLLREGIPLDARD